jgi:hypothetical protein
LFVQRLDYLGLPFRCSLCRRIRHLRKECTQTYGDLMEEDSLEDIPADNYSPLMDSQDLGDYSGLRKEESPEPTVTTFIGKLKLLCPSLYNSLSSWERDHLDSVFLTDLVHQPEVGKEKYLDSVQMPPDLVEIRPMTTPGPELIKR